MLDSLHTRMYRALVTHGGHTHGVHHPQDCATCEAMRDYELRKAAAESVDTNKEKGRG